MHPGIETIFLSRDLGKQPFFLIAGPCVLEDQEMGFHIAEKISVITARLGIPFIFKASYKKANRTRPDSFTGIGDTLALDILERIGNQYDIPVITDIHTEEEARMAAGKVDILQIPAFLSRQTALLQAAGETGKAVNIKKGQFLAPGAMQFAAEKVFSTGNKHVMLTERGTTFGYGDLVVDFRSVPLMQEYKLPVVLDVTHSLQQPNQNTGVSGGQPHLIETIAKAGIAAGVDGIFLETHPEPAIAKSDGANMLPLNKLEDMLEKLLLIRQAIQ
ncbi:MAG: 3-deoxy-8-phosphooctulonate synthase [Bacteroidota bacterium]